jgi:putative membrane protein
MNWLMIPIIADTGPLATPETIWQSWNFDALVLLNLATLGWLYAVGYWRLRERDSGLRVLTGFHAAALFVSLAVIAFALLSPLDALSEQLGSAHMVQHMLLMVVAAPLLIAARPQVVLSWGLPRRWRTLVGRTLRWCAADFYSWPWFVGLLYAVVLWAWHLPVAYQAALFDPLLHDAQHLSFFGAACLFWRVLLVPIHRDHPHPFVAIGLLFFTAIHSMLLGVFMTLAPQVWYGVYEVRTAAWGISAASDQQLAGLLMWLPACLIYPAVAALVFGQWLARLQSRQATVSLAPAERSLT